MCPGSSDEAILEKPQPLDPRSTVEAQEFLENMPYPPRAEIMNALKVRAVSFTMIAGKEFYGDFLTTDYINDRRAELKAMAGLKPSSPKAPQFTYTPSG